MARGALERASAVVAAGALAVLVAQGTGRFLLTPLLPPMQAELRLDDTEAGLPGSLNFAGYLVGAVLVTVVPHLGVARLVPAGLALVTLGALAMPLLPLWPAWLRARLVAGLGGACPRWVRRSAGWQPRRRRHCRRGSCSAAPSWASPPRPSSRRRPPRPRRAPRPWPS